MIKKIAICVILVSFFLISQDVSASASLGAKDTQNMAAPGFTLESVAGKTVSLKDFEGKNLILFFFATWCHYCREKIPSFVTTYPQYQNEGITVLAIDIGESRAKVGSFIAKEPLPFDILLDIEGTVSQDYEVMGVPTFVLISKDGSVAYTGNDLPPNYKELFK